VTTLQARTGPKNTQHRQLCTVVISCNMRDIIHFPPSTPSISLTFNTKLEVLLAPYKTESRLAPLITLDVQCATQSLRSTEEHTCLSRRVNLTDRLENHVPVRATEVSGCAQAGDGVLFGVGVVNHDVRCVVGFDSGREVLQICQHDIQSLPEIEKIEETYGVDFNMVVQILGFNGKQEGAEPFERSEISADPEEVHFPQPCAALREVHAVPDTLQDTCKRRDTNTCTNKYSDFKLEHVFGSGTEGPVDVDTGQDLAHGDFFTVLVFLAASFLVKVASKGFAECAGEVTDHADVHGDVVLFRRGGEGEGMVLPDGYFRAAEENVLHLLVYRIELEMSIDLPDRPWLWCAPS
jgi:hypothetical protein